MALLRALAVTSLLLLLRLRPAAACTPPPPVVLVGMVPASGATGVPTNVQVRVRHGGYSYAQPDVAADIIVRPVGGAAVLATVTKQANAGFAFKRDYVVKPAAPLAPGTVYEVLTRYEKDCSYVCDTSGYHVLGRFTTGAGPDTTPPTFAGVTGISVAPRYACRNTPPCCGSHEGFDFTVDWDPAIDDSGIAAYVITRGDEVMAIRGAHGFAQCGGIYSGGPLYDFFGTSGTYAVHAVDLAGNVDTGTATAALTIDCSAAAQPDAGVTAGDPAETLTDTIDEPRGCAVGGRSRAAGGLVLLALVALRARRRRPYQR